MNAVRNLFTGRKRFVAIGLTGALVLGIAGGAFAFFLTTGTGSGNGSVGNATSWTGNISVTPDGSGTLYPDPAPVDNAPGTNVQYFTLTITNGGSGNQELQSVALAVSIDATHVTAGCNYEWFSVDGQTANGTDTINSADTFNSGSPLPDDLTPGSSWSPDLSNVTPTGDVSVELIDNGADQSSCEGATVTLTATAS